jgi:hypothetical protein
MNRTPTRSFTLDLIKNCPEARKALNAWRRGDMTFEQATMEVVKQLYLSRQDLQRRYDYIPPEIRATHRPPD